MSQTKAKHVAKQLLLGLLGAVMGAGSSFLLFRYASVKVVHLWWLWSIPAALVIAVLVHELGHLAAGLAQGFRFNLLAVGPLHIESIGGRLRWRFTMGFNPGGGLASLYPTSWTPGTRRAVLWFVAGGPAASLLLTLAAAFAARLAQASGLAFGAFACAMLSLVSAFLFLLAVTPFQVGGLMTDGAAIRCLLRGGPAADSILFLSVLLGKSQSAERPRDWPPEVVAPVVRFRDDSPTAVMGNIVAFYHFADRGEYDAAAEVLDYSMRHLEAIPEVARGEFYREQSWFEAAVRRRLDVAREALAQAKPGVFDEAHTRLRAEAAIALLAGDRELARKLAAEGLQHLPQARMPGIAEWEADQLRAVLRDAG